MSLLHIVLTLLVGPIAHHPYSRSYVHFILKYPYFSSSLQFLLVCYKLSYGKIFVIGVIISERPTVTPFQGKPLRLYQLTIDGCVVEAIGRLICQWPGIHECFNILFVDVDDYSHLFFILFAAFIIVSCTVPKRGAYIAGWDLIWFLYLQPFSQSCLDPVVRQAQRNIYRLVLSVLSFKSCK